MENQKGCGNAMGKIVLHEVRAALKEMGDRLNQLSSLEIVIFAPLLSAGFILMLIVAGMVFLSARSKN